MNEIFQLLFCVLQTSFAEDPVVFITNISFVSAFLIQIFLMCMFGQEMVSEYDLLSYRLFSSSWPDILLASKYTDSKNCHKILVNFSEVLQQEKQLLIGKVFPLNLKTFTSVCGFIFTVITMMKYT